MEADEGLSNSGGKVVVHGEVLAGPVDGGAEAAHLVGDGTAVLALPLPDALGEGFAAHLFAAGFAFGGKLLFDHHLGGDAGVIGTRNPERRFAAHAVPAGEDVHLGLVEHVAHVQAAGDVGRRQEHGEGFGGGCGVAGRGVEQMLVSPVFRPFFFDCGRLVGLGQFVLVRFAHLDQG